MPCPSPVMPAYVRTLSSGLSGSRCWCVIEGVRRLIRLASFFSRMIRVATLHGRDPAVGFKTLNVADRREGAGASVIFCLEQKPWDRFGIGGVGMLDRRPDDRAAIEPLPGWPGEVMSDDDTLNIKQLCFRRLEGPDIG